MRVGGAEPNRAEDAGQKGDIIVLQRSLQLAPLLEEERFLPTDAGLLVADRYDAVVMREPSTRPLAPARRKAETLRFARRAARRLSAQIDPSLGDSF